MVSGMTEIFQQTEEFVSPTDVLRNLTPQRCGRFEFYFVPQPLQEIQAGGRDVSRNRSTQHECLDGKALFPERGPNTDIGDTVHKGPAVEGDAGDIDADLRDQFIFRIQIQRRDRNGPSTPGSRNHVAFELNPSAQQTARTRNRSLHYQFADAAAADEGVADSNRRNLDDLNLVLELS